ncbi:MAG: sigma 54-interacting transcriptional regulator [Spirochaetales bacterium]
MDTENGRERKKHHEFIRDIVAGKPAERPLIGVSPGSGHITATAASAGADLFFVFSAGVYRTAGVGSLGSFLAYGNANDQTEELLRRHILPRAGDTPVVAGLMANDPICSLAERLERYRQLGVNAITNWPATGLVDGVMREILAAQGLSHESEREMLSAARREGFATFGFALTTEEVRSFCDAGIDGLILNVGLTKTAKDAMDKRNQVRQAVATVKSMWDVVQDYEPAPLSFLFGGTITQPADFEEILKEVPVHGYAGGSAFERIPVTAIVDSTVRRLKAITRSGGTSETARGAGSAFTSVAGGLVGESRGVRRVRELVRRVAPYDVNVCILGETGTGKEIVAQALHRESRRREMPFITMNCGAIPDSLVESELFGYEKGAFTGADERRKGKFELANHGVLFLDEIGDLSPHGQVALLRVLQQGEVLRIGGQKPVRVDVRIISATNRDLQKDVTDGRFRADLYYRISAMVITLPALRERPDDLPVLIAHILTSLSTRVDRRLLGVTDRFLARLQRYRWPGNVRELEHVLTRAALLEDGAVLEGDHSFVAEAGEPESQAIPSEIQPGSPTAPIRQSRIAPAETRLIAEDAVAAAGGNKSEAARRLGVTRKTLYRWLGRSGS